MAKQKKNRKVQCACGNVLDSRSVRKDGMAYCICGNVFCASQFRVYEDRPRHPRGEYATSSWDADLQDWVLDPAGTFQLIR